MARELDLTNNQYRMLLHQCDALAQAGARDFGNPGDWPQDELETYLYYRNRYFYGGADALLMLNLDFSALQHDWNRQPHYLTYDEAERAGFLGAQDRRTSRATPRRKVSKATTRASGPSRARACILLPNGPVWSATPSTFITATPA